MSAPLHSWQRAEQVRGEQARRMERTRALHRKTHRLQVSYPALVGGCWLQTSLLETVVYFLALLREGFEGSFHRRGWLSWHLPPRIPFELLEPVG